MLILFTVVQALPAMHSIWDNNQAIVLDICEEKTTDKDNTKSNKEYLSFYSINLDLSLKLFAQIYLAESIMPSPCFEKPTPPPDFC